MTLDDPLREKIKETIRTGASPRHVPDEIIEVPGIPHTRTGKKMINGRFLVPPKTGSDLRLSQVGTTGFEPATP
ncbi:hypothetical protein RKE30_17120 [Streptomyces sp. Li-HN-5-11]|uniref:hypothetical protein n=1 Tax=Streptomyces sp. Li-HN-5-11 TaxID=3075432 RepID=UPI0028A9ECC3|nr:hypothetical protein [Streptomyces sp. Li-HN-5-11]WNM32009.1 hypothetical protein RKE30_17120 [Streptomyces sp. Li-HN-5-11]